MEGQRALWLNTLNGCLWQSLPSWQLSTAELEIVNADTSSVESPFSLDEIRDCCKVEDRETVNYFMANMLPKLLNVKAIHIHI